MCSDQLGRSFVDINYTDRTLSALKRIRRYLKSSGRYGPSPFLVGHYGGSGEISQGFCRTSAVNGTTYILGKGISSVRSNDSGKYKIALKDFEETITCDAIVSTPEPSEVHRVARCIAIIDRPLVFSSAEDDAETDNSVDTAVLVFPPVSLPRNSVNTAVHAFVTGEGSMAAPKSRCAYVLGLFVRLPIIATGILYLSTPVYPDTRASAEELLQPYLKATMSLAENAEPLFTLFYMQELRNHTRAVPSSSQIFVPPAVSLLPECADVATDQAEVMFRKAIKILCQSGKTDRAEEDIPFWPPLDPDATEVEQGGDPEEDW